MGANHLFPVFFFFFTLSENSFEGFNVEVYTLIMMYYESWVPRIKLFK